ncbi:MAG TPA: patatin-like phospholipase family protein [Thermohalobaculum sp.]|nr:patatin-like phospholipase family protein [Thermohalobaculum sp.]
MITPDSPDRQYSTRLRTALVLTGSGTAGAYHAGVLRALHEAGIRIDLVAGRGAGAIGAALSAIDGGARLWEADGIWRTPSARAFYPWRTPLRLAGWALLAAAAVFALPLALLALAVLVGLAGLLITLVGFEATGANLSSAYSGWIATLFAPEALPTVIPRLALFALVVAGAILAASLVAGLFRGGARRRSRQGVVWRLIGSPLSASSIVQRTSTELWNLIRGAAQLAAPPRAELARRYTELLGENLGQPGFRELLLAVHDMDARRDLVFAMLGATHRARFFARPSLADGARQAEAFDLSGVAREHALDALAAALTVPLATEPELVTFSPEGPWRGETHRLCDRPGALARLLEEVVAAGVEQVVLLTAAPPPGQVHELSSERSDLRGRAGEQLAAFESAGLRDVLENFAGRFARLFVIRPSHNPLGPLDFTGVFDQRSDRMHSMAELVDRGYEDAYRQFIEPVVGASGERIQSSPAVPGRVQL